MPSKVVDRFLELVQIDTQSVLPKSGEAHSRPSSEGQVTLATMLIEEIEGLGLAVDKFEDGSFLVHLPATDVAYENAPHVVLAAHMDTYFGYPGKAVPKIMTYKGGDVVVNKDEDVVISAESLEGLEGKEIIITDGTTVLGADDKAGVAVQMEILNKLVKENVPHGPLTLWFCVDEEIGELDINVIPKEIVGSWDILWTLDGERFGSLDVGCFICRKTVVTFKGKDAHPGVYPDQLKPAQYAAINFASKVMIGPTPMHTEGMESFYYVHQLEGNASKATLICMPRTFDGEESDQMLENLKMWASDSAEEYGVKVEVEDKVLCHNTRPAIDANPMLIQPAIDAFKAVADITPIQKDIRGGTDGAMVNMAFPELPAPNLGTGCCNLHSPSEFLVIEELEALLMLVEDMIGRYKDATK